MRAVQHREVEMLPLMSDMNAWEDIGYALSGMITNRTVASACDGTKDSERRIQDSGFDFQDWWGGGGYNKLAFNMQPHFRHLG